MTVTYSKDKKREGEYLLRGPRDDLVQGYTVEVTTKAGEVREEVVGKILWTGLDDDGVRVALAKIADDDEIDDSQADVSGTEPRVALRNLYRQLLTALDTVEAIGKSL